MPEKVNSPSSSSSSYRPIREIWAPAAYNMRHIISLEHIATWSVEIEELQLRHNRVLQPGFMRRAAREAIDDARLTKQNWLTDFVCPTTDTAILMTIAAKLVVFYQVESESLDNETQRIYQHIKAKLPDIEKNIKYYAESLIQPQVGENQEQAKLRVVKNILVGKYPGLKEDNPNYRTLLNAFYRVEEDKWMKEATHEIVNRTISPLIEAATIEFNLKVKNPSGFDYVLLGAQGSGKSTVLRREFSQNQMTNAIIISTDNYRAITFGEIDVHLSTEQVFIKSQDSAYMIKELVQKFINEAVVSKSSSRPDLIYDGICYAPWFMDKLLEGRDNVTVSIACLIDHGQIAPRAERRAKDPDGHPADKNRHVNTTSLIQAHADSSKYLLGRLPRHSNINLFNTNTNMGVPVKIASIDTINNTMTIIQLNQMGRFLGKQNLNSRATSRSTLYYRPELERDRFQFTARHQATAILTMVVPEEGRRSVATISLQTSDEIEYAKIEKVLHNELVFSVVNKELMIHGLQHNDAHILRELVRQLSANYRDKSSYLSVKFCQEKALEDLLGQDWQDNTSVPFAVHSV